MLSGAPGLRTMQRATRLLLQHGPRAWRAPLPQPRRQLAAMRVQFLSAAAYQGAQPVVQEPRARYFADHTVYKGKAAMTMKVMHLVPARRR